ERGRHGVAAGEHRGRDRSHLRGALIVTTTPWYAIADVAGVPSPALLVYPDRVRENIARMLAIAGGPARLRPHVKTHKLPQVVRMQLDAGITKFKAATIAEAEMTAAAGAP